MNNQPKRLYRSRNNRMIAGVCGGLGEYFSIDPTLVRLFFVLGTIFGFGSLILIYIALLIIVPEELTGAPSEVIPPAEPVTPEVVDPDNPDID